MSNKASGHSFVRPRRKDLKEMKKNHRDLYINQDKDDKPFSLTIQEETIFTNLKIPYKRYDRTIDPNDQISYF